MALELNGTTGVSLVQDGVVTQADLASGVGGKFVSYAVIADAKSSGTDGGTFTSGDWRTRDLNTEITDSDGIVSISSNQFILGAGDYLIKWIAPAYSVNNHQTRLRNTTDGALVEYGSSGYHAASNQSSSTGSVRVSIAGTKNFEIQHICVTTKATNGLGVGNGSQWTSSCIFTIVEIYKEA